MSQLLTDNFAKRANIKERNRKYLIVKGNRVVQNVHYMMPLADQKVLASLIRSIKPDQRDLKVTFDTNKFARIIGFKKSGKNFKNIKNALYNIMNDNFMMKNPDGSYDSWIWLQHIHIEPSKKGYSQHRFVVTFNPGLKKYLFNKNLRYRTIYRFSDIMLMKSRYSPRLYEIFRSNQSRQKVQKLGINYSLKELKLDLDLVYRRGKQHEIIHNKDGSIRFRYPRIYDFRTKVLRPARREINTLTEYNVRFKSIKHGRKVVGFNVTMIKKNKKQHLLRDDRIYCITHHIPKEEWKDWRKDQISGKFYRVKRHRKHMTVAGSFSVVNHHKQKTTKPKEIKVMLPNGQYTWIDRDVINKSHASNSTDNTRAKISRSNINKLLKKYAKQTDKSGYIQIYNPVVNDNVWTTKSSAVTIAKQLNQKNNY